MNQLANKSPSTISIAKTIPHSTSRPRPFPTNNHSQQAYIFGKEQLNWYWDIRDKSIRQEYIKFCREHRSKYFLMSFTLFVTVCFLCLLLWVCTMSFQPILLVILSLLFINVICDWWLIMSSSKVNQEKKNCWSFLAEVLFPVNIAGTTSATSTVSPGIIVQTTIGEKEKMSYIGLTNTNIEHKALKNDRSRLTELSPAILCCSTVQALLLTLLVYILQEGMITSHTNAFLCTYTFMIFLIPSILFVALPEVTILVQFLILCASLVVILGIEIYNQAFIAIVVTIMVFQTQLTWTIDTHIRSLQWFSMNTKLQPIHTNSIRSELPGSIHSASVAGSDGQAIEMRNMIGNVAHDLKTPLASFITGMDYIQFVLNDCHRNLIMSNNGTIEERTTMLKNYTSSIQSCLNGIRNTNSFMLMTINRCIDYAKAARGFKLVPKFETIDLQDALQLPLDCMHNLQDRITIEMKPIAFATDIALGDEADSHHICPYIVTDKQWLQENILCLLSNAVKYSSRGVVSIEVIRLHHLFDYDTICDLSKTHDTKGELTMQRSGLISHDSSPLRSYPATRHSSEIVVDNFDGIRNDSLRVTTRVMPLASLSQESDKYFHSSSNTLRRSIESKQINKAKGSNKEREKKRQDGSLRRISNMDDENSATFYLALHEKEKQAIIQEPTQTFLNEDVEEAKLRKLELQKQSPSSPNDRAWNNSTLTSFSQGPSSRESQDYLLFEIEDTGIGMSDEAMASLFNPFQQTQRYAGGTGLGLFSLAKRIDALHGYYGVKRRRDGEQGSLFWFMIPYKPDLLTASETLVQLNDGQGMILDDNSGCKSTKSRVNELPVLDVINEDASAVNGDLQQPSPSPQRRESLLFASFDEMPTQLLRIMIVDDSPTLLKMTKMMLTKLGHEVIAVDNGAAAIDYFSHISDEEVESMKIDLILMDMQMPIMDGFETTRRIRTMEKLSNMNQSTTKSDSSSAHSIFIESSLHSAPSQSDKPPQRRMKHKSYVSKIVGMSAYSDDETTQMALESGMDLFIEKPFSAHIFTTVIMNRLFSSST